MTMVGQGSSFAAARDAAYRGVDAVALDGGRYRTDIAARELDLGDGAKLGDEAR